MAPPDSCGGLSLLLDAEGEEEPEPVVAEVAVAVADPPEFLDEEVGGFGGPVGQVLVVVCEEPLPNGLPLDDDFEPGDVPVRPSADPPREFLELTSVALEFFFQGCEGDVRGSRRALA